MKRIIISVLTLYLIFPIQAIAQTERAPSKTQKRRPAARAKQPPTDVRAEAAKVADQLKLLIRFIYLYGRVSAGLESLDEQAKREQTNQDLMAKMQQNKASVVENIKNIRAGLESLERHFNADPRWQRQSLKLIGAYDAVSEAEQLAAMGRFDAAGRTLLGAAERLVDFLMEVR